MKVLPQQFYLHDTTRIARDLLGKILCVRTKGGVRRSRIVETEAYLGLRDQACHSFGGRRTPRTEVMFMEGGHAYVYFIYGMHFCLNVVTAAADEPEAVLIRAVEPLDVEVPAGARKSDLLTNGPGKLCRYYGIGREHNGVKLFSKKSPVWIEDAPAEADSQVKVEKSKRIGVDSYERAKDRLLRFAERANRFVSR